jgi:hypothetical protein
MAAKFQNGIIFETNFHHFFNEKSKASMKGKYPKYTEINLRKKSR